MIRFTFFLMVVAGMFAAATYYPIGDKPLAEHLGDIYRAPVVQEKLSALRAGVGHDFLQLTHGWSKEPKKVRSQKTPAPLHANLPSARAEPSHAEPPRAHALPPDTTPAKPARDQLSDDDRQSLDHLLSQKLHQH